MDDIDNLLDLIETIVNRGEGTWKEKRDAIRDRAKNNEALLITLDEFVSWWEGE